VFHELTPEKVDGLLKQYAFSLSTPGALRHPPAGDIILIKTSGIVNVPASRIRDENKEWAG
jgi:hypothetical protein